MTISSVFTKQVNNEKSVRAGFAVALIMLVSIAAFAYYSIDVLEQSADIVNHTHQVQGDLAQIDALYGRARLRWRFYVSNGDPATLTAYRDAVAELPSRLDALENMVADNSEQAARLKTLREFMMDDLAASSQVVERKSAGGLKDESVFAELNRPRPAVAKANAMLNRMTEEEERLLAIRERTNRLQSAIARSILIGGTATSVAILLLAFFLLSRQMQRLRSAEQNIAALNIQLQKRMEHLEAANRELESFSYSVSHDLRTPLRAISGYARMIEEDQGPRLDDEGRRYLSVVCSEADRMGLLIDDLLTFSRLGRENMKTAEVDMDALAREVISDLRSTAKAAAQIDVQPLPTAIGDRALLRQVWINLVANAIKYAGKRDEPRLWISGGIDDGSAVYSIKDNGAGFDMRHYNKLFGVFERLHAADEFPGTGIGLAIVQRVVTRHGGRVWAQGEPDRGAVFNFSLPLKVPDHG